MRINSILLAVLMLICGKALAADGFDGVRCVGDIPKALIGKHMVNERVAVLEARHRNLLLKDLGATEITDQIDAISWSICGKEYMLLEDQHDVVRDVLPFPSHSRTAPAFTGTCEIDGRATAETIVAILDNSAGYIKGYDLQDRTLFRAVSAWKIDTKRVKFVKIGATGMRCPRTGIDTADGGP